VVPREGRTEAAMAAAEKAAHLVEVVAATAWERAEAGGWEEEEVRVGEQGVEADTELVEEARGQLRQLLCWTLWISRLPSPLSEY